MYPFYSEALLVSKSTEFTSRGASLLIMRSRVYTQRSVAADFAVLKNVANLLQNVHIGHTGPVKSVDTHTQGFFLIF